MKEVRASSGNKFGCFQILNLFLDDFENLSGLSRRINYLIDPDNFEEYLEYFKWRTDASELKKYAESLKLGKVEQFEDDFGLCKLCRQIKIMKNMTVSSSLNLNDESTMKIHNWWYGSKEKPICKS